MIDAVWKNDLHGIAIFRLGRCTSFQLANKMQFVSQFMAPVFSVECAHSRNSQSNGRSLSVFCSWRTRLMLCREAAHDYDAGDAHAERTPGTSGRMRRVLGGRRKPQWALEATCVNAATKLHQ